MTTPAKAANPRGVAVIGDPGRAAIKVPEGSPPSEPWPPDMAASEYAVQGITIRAASVRGVQHRYTGEPRQDAFGIAADTTAGTVVAMVCDGVGDLRYSHEAAAHVCHTLPLRVLDGTEWSTAVAEVNQELTGIAQSRSDQVPEGKGTMATTMISATIRPSSSGYDIHLAWVGDSEAWRLDSGRWTQLAPRPDSLPDGGVATGRTRALPATDPTVTEADFTLASGRIFLMSDGVGTPLKMNTEVQRTLGQWWHEPPDPYTFASQVAFARRTFIDDRTVIGLWCASLQPEDHQVVESSSPDVAPADSTISRDHEPGPASSNVAEAAEEF